MDEILLEILDKIRETGRPLGEKSLEKIMHSHNRGLAPSARQFSKKRLYPYYLKLKQNDPQKLEQMGVDHRMEKMLIQTLQVKPMRTASGVATISVITKPWPCSSSCLYCPNDISMPKSYLSDEPACQRALRNCFDPYMQVVSRLRALTVMGHPTDKIELIVLGGTWSDYPLEYQIWFVEQLFRALNDGSLGESHARKRRKLYKKAGIVWTEGQNLMPVDDMQRSVNDGSITYNQAIASLYHGNPSWQEVSKWQTCTMAELKIQQKINETAEHRVVGLVIETRPDLINAQNLVHLRELGCTKVQIGVQSLDQHVLDMNDRGLDVIQISHAFEMLRAFGFKIHSHFMVNLYGSNARADKADYKRFVSSPQFTPDEVKLYPCSLVDGTGLKRVFDSGKWAPYTEDELVDVLVSDTLATPPFIRISRMIRDIPATDIMAGNKRTNLRQMVENEIVERGLKPLVKEIRYREIGSSEVDIESLHMDIESYGTTMSEEMFLQWVDPNDRIAGFLRLSLPHQDFIRRYESQLPVGLGEAMIREVHVYGKAQRIHKPGENAQHMGLGKALVEEACRISREEGYERINVISSVGTREYYRGLGFRTTENGLYQQRSL